LAHIDNRLVKPFHNNYLFLIVDTIPIVDTVGELVGVLDRGDDIGQASRKALFRKSRKSE